MGKIIRTSERGDIQPSELRIEEVDQKGTYCQTWTTDRLVRDEEGDVEQQLPPKRQITQGKNRHYTDRPIQPIDYILANNLNFCEGNVVKYVTRWRDKGGIEDLRKAIDYLNYLIDDN